MSENRKDKNYVEHVYAQFVLNMMRPGKCAGNIFRKKKVPFWKEKNSYWERN